VDTPITVAVISAAAAIVVPAITFYLTKKKERAADWQKYKFEHYREFVNTLSGIVGTDSTQDGNQRFAMACNTLHLLASHSVIAALHNFQDEIGSSNPYRSLAKHNVLLSKLLWEIRVDLKIPHTPQHASRFEAKLWCSGANAAADVTLHP